MLHQPPLLPCCPTTSPDCLNSKHGPGGWNPLFPRQVDKKCQEETCTFKGQATGKGFVGRFLHGSGSSLSGLAVSSCASNSKTPEEENQVVPSIQRLTQPPPPPLPGEQSHFVVEIRINNESILSPYMPGHLQQQQPAAAASTLLAKRINKVELLFALYWLNVKRNSN